MLTYPHFNPVALAIGPLHIHWYGLMYLIGFFSAWLLALWRIKHYKLNWCAHEVSDLLFYGAIGVIIGGRLGYMLFYNTAELWASPLSLFKIWQGGMSFHGGLIGVMLALVYSSHRFNKAFLAVSDFVAPLVPLGLAAGRLGNFINGELWGRVTDVPWAMVFPYTDGLPRHPSQLYEMGLEGVALFILIWWYARKPRPQGAISAVFLIGYACCRFSIEFFRQPDSQLGFMAFNWLTMGQLLTLPMLLLGLFLWWKTRCKPI
ncbi:MAG: prolipoprotein diacylglyceryl transferase [Legionellaceae bacterium]|nr:prolipoprotein diacylglyceryl transferase [Legionellaceae bacterium]MBJ16479.1 prolipoprotein diacylglyceryl transferase [Legionellaceae bacterium]HCA89770.1 prolipoprotein diacylglyceryl transferase [Legionellales bacterium]|tara:strand:- start:137 stop:919 length:783 start_codon:yes stop_codon:yes gene_type:complete